MSAEETIAPPEPNVFKPRGFLHVQFEDGRPSFKLDLILAYLTISKINKKYEALPNSEPYAWLNDLQAFVDQNKGCPMNPGELNELWYELQRVHDDEKKRLQSSIGIMPS